MKVSFAYSVLVWQVNLRIAIIIITGKVGCSKCHGLADTICLKTKQAFCVDGATCDNIWNEWEDHGLCRCQPGFETTENKQCVCLEGTLTKTGYCYYSFGEACNSGESSYAKCLPGMVCRDYKCSCEFESQEYIKGASMELSNCMCHVGGMCSPLHESCPENSECVASMCQCQTGFVQVNKSCEVAFGNECKKGGYISCDSQAGLECIDGYCQCSEMEFYDDGGKRCRGRMGAPCFKYKQGYCQQGTICKDDGGTGQCVFQETIPDPPSYITEEEFENIKGLEFLKSQVYIPQYNDSTTEHERPTAKRLWTNAQVPYFVDPSFSYEHREQIALAIREYHEKTCIRFIPKESKHTSWLNIIHEPTVCAVAHRCMNSGPQFAKFGGNCVTAGIIIHQLGKTLCMGYEPSRVDRDNWISYNTSVCKPHQIDNQNYVSISRTHKWYDYLSSQHPQEECEIGCIITNRNGTTNCGSAGPLSLLDVEVLNEVYNCTSGCLGYRYVNYSDSLKNATMDLNDDGDAFQGCRLYLDGNIIPGYRYTTSNYTNKCFTYLNRNKQTQGDHIEVLTFPANTTLRWKPSKLIPQNAFVGGRSSDGEPLYVIRCQVAYLDSYEGLEPGYFKPSEGLAYKWSKHGYCWLIRQDAEFLVCD